MDDPREILFYDHGTDRRMPSRSTVDDLHAILTAHLRVDQSEIVHVLAILAWPAGLALLVLFGILGWTWETRLTRLTRR